MDSSNDYSAGQASTRPGYDRPAGSYGGGGYRGGDRAGGYERRDFGGSGGGSGGGFRGGYGGGERRGGYGSGDRRGGYGAPRGGFGGGFRGGFGGGRDRPPMRLRIVYVAHLPKAVTEEQLLEKVSPFGSIKRSLLAKHHETQEFMGYAFVEFEDNRDAEAAIKDLDGKRAFGEEEERLMVEFARKPPREWRDFFGGDRDREGRRFAPYGGNSSAAAGRQPNPDSDRGQLDAQLDNQRSPSPQPE